MVSRIVAGSSVLLLACGSAFASGAESDPSMLVMPQFGLIFWTTLYTPDTPCRNAASSPDESALSLCTTVSILCFSVDILIGI